MNVLRCNEIARLVSEALDRALPFGQRLSVGLHLLMCRPCARFRRQVRFLCAAAHRFPEGGEGGGLPLDVGLSPEARARIKRALESAGR